MHERGTRHLLQIATFITQRVGTIENFCNTKTVRELSSLTFLVIPIDSFYQSKDIDQRNR